ncbi:MAG TPA: STAS domain-containing protein [Geomonas sp.]|nr:STAS domain-containing protein [Geomonas sp.]
MHTPEKDKERPTEGTTHRVALEGDWVLESAAGQLKYLAEQVVRLVERQPRPACAEIDLAMVTGIDACGCQLIAIFLEKLQRQQVTARPCHIPEEVRNTFSQLGFAGILAGSAATEEDAR